LRRRAARLSSISLTGISCLVTCDQTLGKGKLGTIRNATLICEEGKVVYAGPGVMAPDGAEQTVDVGGRCVIPGFVDSHTHLVFSGDRASEFAERMAGRPYRPGGILDTVAATRSASGGVLESRARRLVGEATSWGTTTLEIKSGYGLTVEHEVEHVRIARALTPEATLLAAHVVPAEFAGHREDYVRLVRDTIVPMVAGVARWCDVFCEAGAFDSQEAREILSAGRRHGLGLRVHANQLRPGDGVTLACEMGAASADHCSHLTGSDVDALAASGTVATLLPMSDFCTRQPYPKARVLLEAGAVVALASNCNPGSSYSTSMPLTMALAVRECGMTFEEALWAATSGGAAALTRADVGRLSPGCSADAVVLDAPAPDHLVYRLGVNIVSAVLKEGAWVRRHLS
jgi:imidazolonepropionase